MCFCTLLIRCMAVISIVAIIIFWQVYDLSVSVVKLRGMGFTGLILKKLF